MTKKSSFFKTKYYFFLTSILTGILVGTSYIPFFPWALLFCYLPLWHSLLTIEENTHLFSYKKIFFLAWLSQFTFTIIGFNWLYYTAREFGHLPVVISVLTVILFATFMHLYVPLALTLGIYLKRKFQLTPTSTVFVFALLLSLSERIWPSLFAWNLGYPLLWAKWPIYQWADTVGFLGLSAFILLFQAGLAAALLPIKFIFTKPASQSKLEPVLILTILAVTFAVLNFSGTWKQKNWSKFDTSLAVTVVQGSISNEQKLSAERNQVSHQDILKRYITETEKHLQSQKQTDTNFKTDFIIWPETAVPFPLDAHFSERYLNKQLFQKVSSWNSSLITGSFSVDAVKKDPHGYPAIRNSVFFLNSQGYAHPNYNKSHLLAFGEYMPFGEIFPILYKWLPFVGAFDRGPGPISVALTTTPPTENNTQENIQSNENSIAEAPKTNSQTIKIAEAEAPTVAVPYKKPPVDGATKTVIWGPQICYESLDPAFSRGLTNKEVDIIFNVTNDSWFGDWAEPYQHLIMTMGRAIENRRPLVRSTNTGISGAMLANGELTNLSVMNEPWADTLNIRYKSQNSKSFYTQWGHYDWVLLILSLILILVRGRNAIKP